MNVWLVIIAAGVITYAIRLSFILLFGKMNVPVVIQKALRYVPPAVLSAIVFPELLVQENRLNLSLNNARLIAGVLAALIAWRTKSILLTILVGMAALLILQFLGLQ